MIVLIFGIITAYCGIRALEAWWDLMVLDHNEREKKLRREKTRNGTS